MFNFDRLLAFVNENRIYYSKKIIFNAVTSLFSKKYPSSQFLIKSLIRELNKLII